MENQRPRRREEQRKPTHKRRRLTPKARAAYLRAGLIGAVAIAVLGGGIYGFSKMLPSDASADNKKPVGKDTQQVVKQDDDKVDMVATSTVKVLQGDELKATLTDSVKKLKAANAPTPPTTDSTGGKDTVAPPKPVTPPVPVKFDPATVGGTGFGNIASWKQKNNDVVGWLKVPNTNINFPVVVGPDNLYYNAKGYDKQYSRDGVIWADSDTKFGSRSQLSQNTVLYGHNWTNYSANPAIGRASDVMFGQLTSFHHLNFAKVTPYIHYSTSAESMTWKVFAVFYTEESFNYILSDPGAEGINYIVNEAKSRSRFKYDVDVNSSDKILTLSTCTRAYGKTDKQRFVVMARLMRPGESIEEVSIENAPNHKKPRL